MSKSCCLRIYPVGFRHEFVSLLKVAWPVVLTNLLQFFILTESIIMCGHLDKYQLDGCSLANSILNALGISVGTGLCTACDTLFSQTYGSKYRHRMGIILQRSMLVVSIFPFFLWLLHLNCEPLFIYLGQDPTVAIIAADYMRIFTPGLFFSFHYLVLARYMQNQDKTLPPMVVGLIGNIFNIVSQYVCIYVYGYGYRASAVCEASTFFIMWLLEVIYILTTKLYEETWSGWSVEAFYDWGQFVALALPGVGMITMETVSWEIGTFIAGLLGPTWLGVQAVIFQMETVTFMISFGVSVAVNIRVGQHLGGQDHRRALTAYRVGVTAVLISSSITAIIFASLNNYLPRIFTSDEEVIAYASSICQLLGIFQLVDGVGTVTAGALRGCGRQNYGAGFIFLAYYIFGLPIGISLALLTSMKVSGLWIGIFIGLAVSVPCMVLMSNCQNWRQQAKEALKRIEGSRYQSLAFREDENTTLLKPKRSSMERDAEAEKEEQPIEVRHQRTPSQPMGSSLVSPIDFKAHNLQNLKGVLINRVIISVLALLTLICGICIHVFLPRELYLPKGYLTNTTALPLLK